MDNEFDLRKYFLGVLKRWPLVVLATIVAAATAFGFSMSLPETYTATSSVIVFVRQTGSQVGVNESLLSLETIDGNARRAGLLALAESETIEAQLPQDVLARVVPANYKPGMLVQSKRIELKLTGDFLEITATAPTAQQAKELADAWATTFVSTVSRLYDDQHSRVALAGTALLPLGPSGPTVIRNTVAGALGGFLFGLTVALVTTLFSSTEPTPKRVRAERPAAQPTPTR